MEPAPLSSRGAYAKSSSVLYSNSTRGLQLADVNAALQEMWFSGGLLNAKLLAATEVSSTAVECSYHTNADYRRDLELPVTHRFARSAEKAQPCHRLKREWEVKSLSSAATSCGYLEGSRGLGNRTGRRHSVDSLGWTRIPVRTSEKRSMCLGGKTGRSVGLQSTMRPSF
jgi:hypothetical protein